MAITAIKGLGKAFLKRIKDKAGKKTKKLNKKDIDAFQKKYGKHKKALEAANKPAMDEYRETIKPVQLKIKRTGKETKEDTQKILSAFQKKESKINKVSKKEVYKSMPDIRQRFRAEPGYKRKLTKGVKDWPTRAEILQKNRLKKYGKSKDL